MKKYTLAGLSKFTAFCLALVVFTSSSMLVMAAPGVKQLSAEIIVSGSNDTAATPAVLLNGEHAVSGRTFLASGNIATSEQGSAIINLGKLGRINLSPGSKLSLNFSDNNISGELTSGNIRVLNSEGVSVNIITPDNKITNDATKMGDLSINVKAGVTSAASKSGMAFFNGETGSAPVPQDDDDDDGMGASAWWGVFIIAGAVGAAVIYTMTRSDDELNVISPVI